MFAWKHSVLLAIQKPLSISSIKLISTSLCQSSVQSNYYDVLDVPRTATQKEIREAYINKSREVSAKLIPSYKSKSFKNSDYKERPWRFSNNYYIY